MKDIGKHKSLVQSAGIVYQKVWHCVMEGVALRNGRCGIVYRKVWYCVSEGVALCIRRCAIVYQKVCHCVSEGVPLCIRRSSSSLLLEDSGLQECDTLLLGGWFLTFQRNVVPSSSGSRSQESHRRCRQYIPS